jgi:heat shock protein HslJ
MRTRPALLILSLIALGGSIGLTACSSTGTRKSSGSTTTTPAATADPLAGTAWKLESYEVPPSPTVHAAPGAIATLVFDTAGALGGSTGCNQFGGTYTIDGSRLSIGLGPMTQMACAAPEVNTQEAALVKLLAQVTGFAITGDRLTYRVGQRPGD